MLWIWLSALANRWLLLTGGFTGAVLVALGLPGWFALASTLLVLGVGSGVGARAIIQTEKQRRGIPTGDQRVLPGRDDVVRDPYAAGIISRAQAAVARIATTERSLETAPTSLAIDIGVQADRTLGQLRASGQHVDRLVAALAGTEAGSLQRELAAVEDALARDRSATPELTAERRRSAAGLRAQLGSITRLNDQRQLLLERMRATAVGLEGLATRTAEVAALYHVHGWADTSGRDLANVGEEIEGLRASLVEADRSVRAALSDDEV